MLSNMANEKKVKLGQGVVKFSRSRQRAKLTPIPTTNVRDRISKWMEEKRCIAFVRVGEVAQRPRLVRGIEERKNQ